MTAIIDGTGSVGAALGPLIFGLVVDESVSTMSINFMLLWVGFTMAVANIGCPSGQALVEPPNFFTLILLLA